MKFTRKQNIIFVIVMLASMAFAFFVCAVSIENEWTHDYPLPGSVDDYGCYPQMFDAFQKGRLDIDTDFDLSRLASLENPYDRNARFEALGVRNGVFWDRAYYNGKLYSYFGIAPVIFLYYPFYFLTGRVLSDALTATILVCVSCVALMLILRELVGRLSYSVPFPLFALGAGCLPFGALLYSTETCANFYHIAVLAGISAVSCTFLFLLYAEKSHKAKRKIFFVLAGICAACILATRPNLMLYTPAALPLIIALIIKRPNGTKSLILDAVSFAAPAIAGCALIMVYNHARFGSAFDFGNNYQLTLWDMSTITFSVTMIIPALFHYFLHPPLVDGAFPFLHPSTVRLSDYGVNRPVYVAGSVGAICFPCTWGLAYLPYVLKGTGKKSVITAVLATFGVFAIAVTDMSYAGIHLRYAADIMFVLTLGGVFGFVAAVGKLKSNRRHYRVLYTVAVLLFVVTAIIDIALCFDNERDMIYKFHREFYDLISNLF